LDRNGLWARALRLPRQVREPLYAAAAADARGYSRRPTSSTATPLEALAAAATVFHPLAGDGGGAGGLGGGQAGESRERSDAPSSQRQGDLPPLPPLPPPSPPSPLWSANQAAFLGTHGDDGLDRFAADGPASPAALDFGQLEHSGRQSQAAAASLTAGEGGLLEGCLVPGMTELYAALLLQGHLALGDEPKPTPKAKCEERKTTAPLDSPSSTPSLPTPTSSLFLSPLRFFF
jgi:hypothetical protein